MSDRDRKSQEKYKSAHKERVLESKRVSRIRHIDKAVAYASRYRENNPEKNRAHLAVRRAIVRGLLVRQPCVKCGNVDVQAHHEDYTKQLEVVWLCRHHHMERHKEIDARTS